MEKNGVDKVGKGGGGEETSLRFPPEINSKNFIVYLTNQTRQGVQCSRNYLHN